MDAPPSDYGHTMTASSGHLASPVARVLAFYLPQFHPIAENNAWWGAGFTEWTNVSRAKRWFPGHVQPRLPADLGFYDLRVPETREAQADLARQSGIEGFCYWHYWFGNGRRILERPFQEVLDSRSPNFPFSLAWANDSWSGIWHGKPGTTLVEQQYPGREDEAAHFAWARRAFEDPRYQRVEGKPIFVVFAPNKLPDSAAFVDHWRELAHEAGYPGMYMVGMTDKFRLDVDRYHDPCFAPFDAIIPHPPHDYLQDLQLSVVTKVIGRVQQRQFGSLINRVVGTRWHRPRRFDYGTAVQRVLHDLPDEERFLPAVMPGWDNTPRSGKNGVVFENATPALFGEYLRKAVARVASRPPERRIVFLKAWNEWAEGNFVEPDALYGHAFLDTLRDVLLPHGATAGKG